MDLSFQALWLLCALGAAAFAAVPAHGKRSITLLLLSFAGTLLLTRSQSIVGTGWIAPVVTLLGLLALFRSPSEAWAAVGAGVSAASWSTFLAFQGLPMPASLLVAAGLPALSSYFATRRPAFAPAHVRDEALVGVVALGLVAAVLPDVSAGWRSAVRLNLESGGIGYQVVPAWVLVVTGASAVLGGLCSVWVRRRTL